MRIRRVVTAQSVGGGSVFAVNEEVAPVEARVRWYGVWGWDEAPLLPCLPPSSPTPSSVFPPVGGVRVAVTEFPPGAGLDTQASSDAADLELFGRLVAQSQITPQVDALTGLSANDTADVAIVISGEICLEHADGAEQVLRPGDVLLQMGTLHAWRNRTEEPCVIGFVMLGLQRNPGT